MSKFKKVFKGRYVREQIAADLFKALHQANLADVVDDEEPERENDLPHGLSRQDSLFGHLAEAIKALGYKKEYDFYCDAGELPEFCHETRTETTISDHIANRNKAAAARHGLDLYETYVCNEEEITEGPYKGKARGEVTGWEIVWVLSTDEHIKSFPLFDCVITKNDNGSGGLDRAVIWPKKFEE